MNEKQCSRCGVVKPIDEFYHDVTNKTGYKSACVKCIKNKVPPKVRVEQIKYCSNPGCSKILEGFQKKFCSRTCSATVSNSRRKIDKFCQNTECGKLLTAKHKKQYCSVKCSVAVLNQERLTVWLETGECVAGSSPTHYVRLFILEEQQYLCEICCCPREHNGKPLVFILDHINGNAEDNRRENLRLVCPNCDSQLGTYKSKNRGNGRHSRRQRYADGKSF